MLNKFLTNNFIALVPCKHTIPPSALLKFIKVACGNEGFVATVLPVEFGTRSACDNHGFGKRAS